MKDIEIRTITNKDELVEFYAEINALFERSFGKPLEKMLWNWAYIDNPIGSPVVTIALSDRRIVGHYAVIPMPLRNEVSKLKSYLSMTTMVDPDYRGRKLFTALAERTYSKIKELREETLVYGFPNNNSAPGFIKNLGWNILTDVKLFKSPSSEIDKILDLFKENKKNNSFTIDLFKKEFYQWRSKKPGGSWFEYSGVEFKENGSGLDIMKINEPENKFVIDRELSFISKLDDVENSGIKVVDSIDYPFGYRLLNSKIKPQFFIQMSMSDVF